MGKALALAFSLFYRILRFQLKLKKHFVMEDLIKEWNPISLKMQVKQQ